MELSTLFLATVQTSFFLGLLHGINPCGHSWLVLAPFVSSEHRGKRVALLTASFLSGTAIACILLGSAIGAVSGFIPSSSATIIETGTALLLLILGICLLYKPHLLHHHDHDTHHGVHENQPCHHNHAHETKTASCCHTHQDETSWVSRLRHISSTSQLLAPALFLVGFLNMIIPCPTVAIMYSYALNSGRALEGLIVFGIYAISTTIAVSCVITLIFLVTNMAGKLQKKWIEPLIMRISGIIIIVFSIYELCTLY